MGIRLPCPIDEAFDLREDDEVLIQAPGHPRSWRGMGLGAIGDLERIRSLRQPLPLGCRVDCNVANDQGRAGPPIRYVALRLGGQSAIGLRSVCVRAGLDQFASGGAVRILRLTLAIFNAMRRMAPSPASLEQRFDRIRANSTSPWRFSPRRRNVRRQRWAGVSRRCHRREVVGDCAHLLPMAIARGQRRFIVVCRQHGL